MTGITALLTTYIPPQMEAAASPARIPNKGDLFIIAQDVSYRLIIGTQACFRFIVSLCQLDTAAFELDAIAIESLL